MARYSQLRGFTLLELSIVLLIVSVVVGGGITVMNNAINQRQYNETVIKMEAIQAAVFAYRNAYNRIPCPAGLAYATTKSTAPTFGTEVGTPGNGLCASADVDTNAGAANIIGGSVPVKTLQLPDDYAFDGWGRRMEYIVDRRYTATGAFTTYAVDTVPVIGDIQVNDGSGNSINSTAIQLLISFGKDGHGARNRQGTGVISTGSTNANQLENCQCTNVAVAQAPPINTIFVQAPSPLSGASTTTSFDDMVLYNTRRTLANSSE